MAIEKSEGLILRVILFRDTSKVLTVYTAEHGLVSVLAKGVRGPKPRFGSALEHFATADLVYYNKATRELQLLSQATLLDPHLGLSNHSLRYAFGMAVLEFLLKVLTGQEPPGRLYPMSIRTLEVLETCSLEALSSVFRAFEVKAVSFLGHRPELYRCVDCGGEPGGNPGFSPHQGGVVCANCAGHVHGVLLMPPSSGAGLRRLLTSTLTEVAEHPLLSPEIAGVGRLLEPFLQAHVERYESLRAVRMADSVSARL